MDKVVQEGCGGGGGGVREAMLKREAERKLQIEKKKEEKDHATQDQVRYFMDTFLKRQKDIEEGLKVIEEGNVDRKYLSDHFDKWNKELQNLNRFLSVSTIFLHVYATRKCIESIELLETKLKELEEKLLPKKKFGFKSKKTLKQQQNNIEKKLNDTVDGDTNKLISCVKTVFDFCGFVGKKNEILTMNSDEILKKDIELSKLENCTIRLYGNPSTLHITDIKNCKIFSGPVSTSVFVENCDDCIFVFPCQQLRVHSTHNSNFYIHVTSRAIIEDTDSVQFAPFNWKYNDINKHFEISGLDTCRNNWDTVDDFNWLATDVPSPNWKIMDESERIQDW